MSDTPADGNLSNKRLPLNGIRYVEVTSARQMVESHTRGRLPPTTKIMGNQKDSFTRPLTTVLPRMTPPRSNHLQQQEDLTKIKMAEPVTNIQIPAPSHSEEPCNNPQCVHCGAVIIPSPQSSLPINETPSISINNWEVYTTRKPILNATELQVLEDRYDIPLPEMIFGHNKVEIYNTDLKWGFGVNIVGAMDLIKTHIENPDELIKVSYANEWYKARQKQHSHSNTEESIIDVYKPYDWTYTTPYKGDEFPTNTKNLERNDELTIPLNKLTERVPILFFQEFVLYEDELGDNGISILSVKIRCMKHCMLLLLRFFLRVDNVLFRIYDTRFYVDFEENTVIREFKRQESTYEYVMSKVSPTLGDPRSLLRDSNWCSTVLETLSVERDFVQLN